MKTRFIIFHKQNKVSPRLWHRVTFLEVYFTFLFSNLEGDHTMNAAARTTSTVSDITDAGQTSSVVASTESKGTDELTLK